jgi:hypothetical protein
MHTSAYFIRAESFRLQAKYAAALDDLGTIRQHKADVRVVKRIEPSNVAGFRV